MQIQLNYLDWTMQDAKRQYEIITEHDLPVWVMEPVRGGKLVSLGNKYDSILKKAKPDWSIPAWAFHWLLGLDNVTMILSGMSTMEQMRDNVATFQTKEALTREENMLLMNAAAGYQSKLAVPCTAWVMYAMHGMAVLSTGEKCENPGYYRQAQKRLAREQRKLSHCRKGSRNYQKQKRKVARCHEKVRNQRKDYHHKLSFRLAEEYDAVAVEDLDLKAMIRGLNFGKSVMDNGDGNFLNMLSYKLEQRGKVLVKTDRFYPSSKKCSKCGKVKETLALSERTYHCSCGNHMDRDVNAAINIREEGKRLLCA